VDDGSTDSSLAVIERYRDRLTILATENAGQREAMNRGFELTSGEVVIFLDSDDILPPELPARLAAAWRPGVSKVQFQMQRVTAGGDLIGHPFPDYEPEPTAAQISWWAFRTSAYPTPPGSGNAYARWFLDLLMPIGDEVGEAADSALLATAPFVGDVVSVPGVTIGYRQHGRNDSNLVVDGRRFAREVARARARWRFARTHVGDAEVDEQPLFRSRELLQLRVAAEVFTPAHGELPGDRPGRMAGDALGSLFQPGPEPWRRRLLITAWSVATLAAPRPLARRLVISRYTARSGAR